MSQPQSNEAPLEAGPNSSQLLQGQRDTAFASPAPALTNTAAEPRSPTWSPPSKNPEVTAKIQHLEHRLLTRLNEVEAENQALKEEMSCLRQERAGHAQAEGVLKELVARVELLESTRNTARVGNEDKEEDVGKHSGRGNTIYAGPSALHVEDGAVSRPAIPPGLALRAPRTHPAPVPNLETHASTRKHITISRSAHGSSTAIKNLQPALTRIQERNGAWTKLATTAGVHFNMEIQGICKGGTCKSVNLSWATTEAGAQAEEPGGATEPTVESRRSDQQSGARSFPSAPRTRPASLSTAFSSALDFFADAFYEEPCGPHDGA